MTVWLTGQEGVGAGQYAPADYGTDLAPDEGTGAAPACRTLFVLIYIAANIALSTLQAARRSASATLPLEL